MAIRGELHRRLAVGRRWYTEAAAVEGGGTLFAMVGEQELWMHKAPNQV